MSRTRKMLMTVFHLISTILEKFLTKSVTNDRKHRLDTNDIMLYHEAKLSKARPYHYSMTIPGKSGADFHLAPKKGNTYSVLLRKENYSFVCNKQRAAVCYMDAVRRTYLCDP